MKFIFLNLLDYPILIKGICKGEGGDKKVDQIFAFRNFIKLEYSSFLAF